MKSFVVSGCLTAVTDLAAVSLFWRSSVFFWRSSGFFCVIERQKNPEEPRRTQKEKNTSPPDLVD